MSTGDEELDLFLGRGVARRTKEAAERRERIATAALQGLIVAGVNSTLENDAEVAVRYADTLIAELAK